jgi:hypothetical protein
MNLTLTRTLLIIPTILIAYFFATNWLLGISILAATVFIVFMADKDYAKKVDGPVEFVGSLLFSALVSAVLFVVGVETIKVFTNLLGSTSWTTLDIGFAIVVFVVIMYNVIINFLMKKGVL